MTTLAITELKRSTLVGCACSAVIFLLLVWQASFKVSANQSTDVVVEQNLIPAFDLNVEDLSFDFAVSHELPTLTSLNIPSTVFSGHAALTIHDVDVPQSRAPPLTL